jgi:hypothetical protein
MQDCAADLFSVVHSSKMRSIVGGCGGTFIWTFIPDDFMGRIPRELRLADV